MESPLAEHEAGTPSDSRTEYCSWELQDTMLALRLWIVEWLGYEFSEALKSPDKPGEVGGILLGQTRVVAHKKIILVERFVPVPCESDGLWHLSQKDKGFLTEQLERWKPGVKKFYPIGFYRSHNREGLALDGEDLALARDFFAGPDNVFLLVKPQMMVGGFIFWKNREIAVKPDLTFPFSRERLHAGKTTTPLPGFEGTQAFQGASVENSSVAARQDEPAPQARAVSESPSPAPATEPAERREPILRGTSEPARISPPSSAAPAIPLQLIKTSAFSERLKNMLGRGLEEAWISGRARMFLFVAVLAFAMGTGYLMVARRSVAPGAAETMSRLDLQVGNERNLLVLNWNKDSSLIAAANTGILSIKDGTYQQNVELNSTQLHGGAFEYAPRTADVTFRLAVRTPAGDVGEWVQVVGKDWRAPAGRTVVKPHSRGWTGPGVAPSK